MANQADVNFQDNKLFVAGDLDFSNVMSVYKKSLVHLKQCNELYFDFSQLNSSNSAGLALIIEWIKFANKCHKSIKFENLSKDLLSIAKAAGVQELIQGNG